MIKKHFIDNTSYGTDELNEVVGSLRTTGIDGTITDCLKITVVSNTTVNIGDGVGWVDGCRIEKSGNETLTLPTDAGNYSVIMKLNKNEGVVNDISIAYEPDHTVGNHVLAWATVVAGSTISVVTDMRAISTFKGVTVINTSTANGVYSDTTTIIAGSSSYIAHINTGIPASRGRIFLLGYLADTGALIFFDNDSDENSISISKAQGISTSFKSGNSGLSYGAFGGISIQKCYIDGSQIIIEFKNSSTSNQTLKVVKGLWQVEV